MNVVGKFEKLRKVSHLIETAVEYCWKVTFYTSQGTVATVSR